MALNNSGDNYIVETDNYSSNEEIDDVEL